MHLGVIGGLATVTLVSFGELGPGGVVDTHLVHGYRAGGEHLATHQNVERALKRITRLGGCEGRDENVELNHRHAHQARR